MSLEEVKRVLFPEFPSNAFDAFDLDNIPQPPERLRRSYRAVCQYCSGQTFYESSYIRIVVCLNCNHKAKFLQNIFKSCLIRKKFLRIRKKELVTRWFYSRNVNGSDLSSEIIKYV